MDDRDGGLESGAPTRNLGNRFRMPWGFGPTTGPRMHHDGSAYDYSNAPRTTAAVSFLTDAAALEMILPPGFYLEGEPVVTIEVTSLTELEWLAGRGYSMLAVRFPARYQGSEDIAVGPFLAVLWENRAEPIISGREELGFAKLYCELPPEQVLQQRRIYRASWDGHEFMHMELGALRDTAPPRAAAVATAALSGTLHYRYVPKVSAPGRADVEQAVLTPAGGFPLRHETFQVGEGVVEFRRSTWQQLPTMHHIVNTLAELPIREARGGQYARTRGSKDLSDQRVLR